MGSRIGEGASRMRLKIPSVNVKTEWRQQPDALTQAFAPPADARCCHPGRQLTKSD